VSPRLALISILAIVSLWNNSRAFAVRSVPEIKPIKIIATISVLGDFAEEIGKDRVFESAAVLSQPMDSFELTRINN